MKTKCPHCGCVRKQSSREGYHAFWCGTYLKEGGESTVRHQHCEDLETIIRLTEELNEWKKLALKYRDQIAESITPKT